MVLTVVEGPVWDATVVALAAGNQTAAGTCTRLAGALSGSGGMAGDDANAAAFAPTYDRAAQAALDDTAQVVGAFAALARLTRASLDHHHAADSASTIWCGEPDTPPYAADAAYGARDLVVVPRRSVPASRGAALVDDLPGPQRWVLDHVRGFVWPDADVDRLRAAGRAWAAAADEVDQLYRHCRTARGALDRQTSPEIPVALTALGNLDAATTTVGSQLRGLGLACATYADDVETHRHEIVRLVVELLAGAAVVEGIGFVLGAVSAGLTTAGASLLNAARIAEKAPAILRVVESLVTLTRGTSAALRLGLAALGPVGTTLDRLASARVLTTTAHAVTMRGVGGVDVPLLPVPPTPLDLCDHEGVGGAHTIRKHVGRTDEEMRNRLLNSSRLPAVSSFPDSISANRDVAAALAGRRQEVADWLAKNRPRIVMTTQLTHETGRWIPRDGPPTNVTGVRMVLDRDSSFPGGYRVQTSYPVP